MNWWPDHHPACFCWIERGRKQGHPSDRCKCGRCVAEADAKIIKFNLQDKVPQSIPVAQWDAVQPHIAALRAAGYYISPVGEIEGDVYIEVEEEAVGIWQELTQAAQL